MNKYAEDNSYVLYHGNMQDMLEIVEPESIDAIVTDPPYELNFMGRGWDNAGVSFQKETWKKCLEALKPGGYLLAFGGSRTYHRIACAIEDAGFEIRDCIMWLYGSGFPKSMNIGLAVDKKRGVDNRTGKIKLGTGTNHTVSLNTGLGHEYEERQAQNEWKGWGTCLKPSYEPIVVARKPFKGSLVDNVLKYGVGGLNIDECRVPFQGDNWGKQKSGLSSRAFQSSEHTTAGGICEANDAGRFPANVIHDGSDEVVAGMPFNKGSDKPRTSTGKNAVYGTYKSQTTYKDIWSDNGSAARYFYCAKATNRDREEGLDRLDGVEKKQAFSALNTKNGTGKRLDGAKTPMRYNIHPTVKPTSLMQYLVRLVSPRGGVILDPFMGSGSTGKAVMYENRDRGVNYKFIGIELTDEYLPIAEARIKYAIKGQAALPLEEDKNGS